MCLQVVFVSNRPIISKCLLLLFAQMDELSVTETQEGQKMLSVFIMSIY